MNRSFCNTCGKLAPSAQAERDGKVYLVKDCPACGKTETLIASDARRYFAKRALDYGHRDRACHLECASCQHTGAPPSFAFVDVTNRCNMDCPVCCDNVPSMGFSFDPPLPYFERLFGYLAKMEPKPTVALFGGEPTMRDDIFEIIALSRKHGLNTRVVTNGLKLADAEYCDRMLASRANILLSYDGARAETYRRLRGTERSLALKQKALENLERSPRIRPGRVSIITCVATEINGQEMPELLDFYHSKRAFVGTVHLMPLAHTWKCGTLGPEPQRTTTEDAEELVARVYPDDKVDFIPAGFIAQFSLVSSLFAGTVFPFLGAHPNCESVTLLLSDGKGYVPVSRYLTCSLSELARDLMALERRIPGAGTQHGVAHAPRPGFRRLLHKVLLSAAMVPFIIKHVRIGRVLKGKGPGKLWHAAALLGRVLTGQGRREALADHTNVQGTLQLIVLPFEDNYVIETDRLERCPNLHVYLDPATEELRFVPVCAWRMFNKKVMSGIADFYAAHAEPAPVAK